MATDHAADLLRAYLDRVGFQQIYKYLVAVNRYALIPSVVGGGAVDEVREFFDTVLADQRELGLVECLLYGRELEHAALSDDEPSDWP